MLSPLSVCLSVCLLVYEQDVSKSYEWILMKLGGQAGCVISRNRFDFGEDPDPDTRGFFLNSLSDSPLRDRATDDI